MSGPGVTVAGAAHVSVETVVTWLRAHLGETLGTSPEALATDVPLAVYGVSSLVCAVLLADLEDAYGVQLDPADVPVDVSLGQLAGIAAAARRSIDH